MNLKEIRLIILELSSEDAWGSWELWWNVSAETSDKNIGMLREQFIDVVQTLIEEHKLVVLSHKDSKLYHKAIFERSRLEFEVDHSDKPDPSNFYWFETTEEGKKEDLLLRSKNFSTFKKKNIPTN